jgi:hypothetical protein
MYTYKIEDGRFSQEINYPALLGYEKDIVNIPNGDDFSTEAYIICVEDKTVHCLGSIERDYPKNNQEHESYKSNALYKEPCLGEYLITYFDDQGQVVDSPECISAFNEQEAINLFHEDYPQTKLHSITQA